MKGITSCNRSGQSDPLGQGRRDESTRAKHRSCTGRIRHTSSVPTTRATWVPSRAQVHVRDRAVRAVSRISVVVALVLLSPALVRAQEDPLASPSGWQVGGSIGIPGAGTELGPLQLFTVNVHAATGRPNGLGVDLAFGTLPRLIVEGVLPIGARVGATIRVTSGDLTWWPSAGLTMAALAGEGQVAGIKGVYLGSAWTWFREGSPTGLRIDWTLHEFGGAPVWVLEFGFVQRNSRKER